MAIEATANNDLRNIMPAKPEERQEVTPIHNQVDYQSKSVLKVYM